MKNQYHKGVWIENIKSKWTGFLTAYLLKMRENGGIDFADRKLY